MKLQTHHIVKALVPGSSGKLTGGETLTMPLSGLQVNKNWLLKARLGNDSAAAAVVLKAWWQPSATFALSAIYDFARRLPRFGFTFNIENYGNIRCLDTFAVVARIGA